MRPPNSWRSRLAHARLRARGRLRAGRRRGCLLESGVLPLEPLHAAGAVHQLLLARIERMALGTDVQVQKVALVSRARLEGVTTRADHIDLMIVRVNLVLHKTPCLPPEQTFILAASPETFNSCFDWLGWWASMIRRSEVTEMPTFRAPEQGVFVARSNCFRVRRRSARTSD